MTAVAEEQSRSSSLPPITGPTLLSNAFTNAQVLAREPGLLRYAVPGNDDTKEGWVLFSVCIGVDGAVRDPLLERSSGPAAFETFALTAVRAYVFSPALREMAASENCSQSVLVEFEVLNTPPLARPKFAARWRDVQHLVRSKSFALAMRKIAELRPWNNYERAQVAMLRLRLARAQNNAEETLRQVSAALYLDDISVQRRVVLEEHVASELRHLQFSYAAALGQPAIALNAYRRLEQAKEPLALSERAARAVLLRQVNSNAVLSTRGSLTLPAYTDDAIALWSSDDQRTTNRD